MKELSLYNFALKYLSERIKDDSVLEHYLYLYRSNNLNSLEETFGRILEHAKNRRGMPYSIGDLQPLKKLLYNFNPLHVVANFSGWENIFNHIQDNYQPPGRMDINNKRNYWVIFCKSIYSGAQFLSRFQNFPEFKNYCNSFVEANSDTRVAFALLLSREIDGFGFALACDFLKEWVSPQFVKPDTHIRDIFIGTGFSASTDSDFTICRKLIDFSNKIDKFPYTVDKAFWLVGSGRLHVTNERLNEVKFKTSKQDFIKEFNSN
ncbi:MAG TPA: hypothetical protein VEC12_15220 [Bacteroidia bacterium]|nr:hypothetical protein [Bacteroidia bacterium]